MRFHPDCESTAVSVRREYTIDALIDGREETINGTACQQPDGLARMLHR